MSNILVTGATGQLGKAVVESLLKKTNPRKYPHSGKGCS